MLIVAKGNPRPPEPWWQPRCVAGVKRERGGGIWCVREREGHVRGGGGGGWGGGGGGGAGGGGGGGGEYFPLLARQKLPLSIPHFKAYHAG